MSKFFFIVVFIFLNASSVFSMSLGSLTISGTGCVNQVISELKSSSNESHRYLLPLHLVLTQKVDSNLDRKVCQFSWPIKIDQEEKLQISNLSQKVTLNGAKVKVLLSVFAVGEKDKATFEYETKTIASTEKDFKKDGILFETKCGKDALLRGNLSSFTQEKGDAAVSSGDLQLVIRAVSCK